MVNFCWWTRKNSDQQKSEFVLWTISIDHEDAALILLFSCSEDIHELTFIDYYYM